MKKSLFEQMGGTYKQVGDFFLPDVELPQDKSIGIWGKRHHDYLRKTNSVLFSQLIIRGKMNEYIAEIDKQAEEMFEQLVKQMSIAEGITEQLKAENQLEWVRRMNNIRSRANEIIYSELIYI